MSRTQKAYHDLIQIKTLNDNPKFNVNQFDE